MQIVLAYRIYPSPEGTRYYEHDLRTSQQVEGLFDYCQILEAIIYKEGWDFLINKFGYSALFQINLRSGWHDCNSIEEFIQILNDERNQSLSAVKH